MAWDHMRGNVVSVESCSLRSILSCCAVECIFLSYFVHDCLSKICINCPLPPHQLILTLLYQIIPDMVDIILFDVVSKYIFGTLLANG